MKKAKLLNILAIERVVAVVASVALIVVGYFSYQQHLTIEALTQSESNLTSNKSNLEEALETASGTIALLEGRLSELGEEFEELEDDYRDERNRNEDFEDQIKDINKTVGILDKLSKTDEELLQKYSKVYFLNEHYVPESLKQINNEWKYNEEKDLKLHTKVMPYFNDMLEDAKADGVELWVVSAYRSYYDQAVLKGQYLITYGSGANAFSADQGYSEHQLGTTIDFTTRGLGGGLNGFSNTAAFTWLRDNAHLYGFTLSYPENNAYYEYEPWHWRFVGEKLARDLKKDSANFYDWEQRKIDSYLINIFD